jgi:hypothetical protein
LLLGVVEVHHITIRRWQESRDAVCHWVGHLEIQWSSPKSLSDETNCQDEEVTFIISARYSLEVILSDETVAEIKIRLLFYELKVLRY